MRSKYSILVMVCQVMLSIRLIIILLVKTISQLGRPQSQSMRINSVSNDDRLLIQTAVLTEKMTKN